MTTRIAIVFLCFAWAGHARRMSAVGGQVHIKRSNEESTTDSFKSLATLLLALNPEDAFHAPIGGARAPTGTAMGPRGLQASRPMVMGRQPAAKMQAERPSVGDLVEIVGLRRPGWPRVGKIVADDKSDRPFQVEGMYAPSDDPDSKELCRFRACDVELEEECNEEESCPVDFMGLAEDCIEEGCPVDKIEEFIALLKQEDLGIDGRIAISELETELLKSRPDKDKLSVAMTSLKNMLNDWQRKADDFFKNLSP